MQTQWVWTLVCNVVLIASGCARMTPLEAIERGVERAHKKCWGSCKDGRIGGSDALRMRVAYWGCGLNGTDSCAQALEDAESSGREVEVARYGEMCRRRRWAEACLIHAKMVEDREPVEAALDMMTACLYPQTSDDRSAIRAMAAANAACDRLVRLWAANVIAAPSTRSQEVVAETRTERARSLARLEERYRRQDASSSRGAGVLEFLAGFLGAFSSSLSASSRSLYTPPPVTYSAPAPARPSSGSTNTPTTERPSRSSPTSSSTIANSSGPSSMRSDAAGPSSTPSGSSSSSAASTGGASPAPASTSANTSPPNPSSPGGDAPAPARPSSPPSRDPPAWAGKQGDPGASGPPGKEGLSYCWPLKNMRDRWNCDGPLQKTLTDWTLEEALKYSGCKQPRMPTSFREGRLYGCTLPLKSYDVDIRQRYGITDR